MLLTNLPIISQRNIQEQIYSVLVSRIVTQEFAPGTRLSVPDLAAALRVSRTPVKEAINRLALEGLVVIHPRRGTYVARVTADSIRELLEVRMMVEMHAGEMAAGLVTNEDLAEFESLLTEMAAFANGDYYTDYLAFIAVDNRFHLKFFQIVGNSLLMEFYENVLRRVQVVRSYQRAPRAAKEARQTQAEHRAILDAMQARNAEQVRKAIRTHVSNRTQQFIDALERNPVLDEADGGHNLRE